jgi:hypothetical protein
MSVHRAQASAKSIGKPSSKNSDTTTKVLRHRKETRRRRIKVFPLRLRGGVVLEQLGRAGPEIHVLRQGRTRSTELFGLLQIFL